MGTAGVGGPVSGLRSCSRLSSASSFILAVVLLSGCAHFPILSWIMVPSASRVRDSPTISANQMRALRLPSLLASLCERPVGHGDTSVVGQERTDHDGQEAALMSFEYVDQKLIIVHPHLAPCVLVTVEVTGVLEADMKAGQPVKICIEEKENHVVDGDAPFMTPSNKLIFRFQTARSPDQS